MAKGNSCRLSVDSQDSVTRQRERKPVGTSSGHSDKQSPSWSGRKETCTKQRVPCHAGLASALTFVKQWFYLAFLIPGDLLAHNVFCHFRDLAPLFLWKLKAPRHDLFPHVFGDCPAVVLGVKRWVTTQHHINDDAKGPQVTALRSGGKKKLNFSWRILMGGPTPSPMKLPQAFCPKRKGELCLWKPNDPR